MKRSVTVVTVLALLLQMPGCSTTKVHRVAAPDLPNPGVERIVGITTTNGQEVTFQVPPDPTIQNGRLTARTRDQPFEIAVDEIERYWIERRELNTIQTVGLIAAIAVGTLAVIIGVALATKESCPFVYSWDGRQYVFDAEPYGGAITRGLERDDYSELEHLRPENGRYHLMISNEVAETQYTNLMELVVADHATSRVAMDDGGALHAIGTVQPPDVAVDETGRDLLPWLRATDRLIWEREPERDPDAPARQEIHLTFPKASSATSARLVVNAATSLWGSYMIKALSELRGNGIHGWYSAMDNSPMHRAALRAWNEREELFMLKIDVKEPEGWVQRGLLLGGGPFVLEDRVVDLDVRRATGHRLEIRVRPPKGFWAFNQFGVDYTSNQPIEVQTMRPVECRDSTGRDRLPQIAASDNAYYDMPNIGDRGYLSFDAPPSRPGLKRTVFLHTRGYYRIHLDDTGQSDPEAAARIDTVPDAAARFSGSRFAAWLAEQQRVRPSPRR